MIKSFSEYKLPTGYESLLYAYFDEVRQILGPKLKMFMLFGSCGLGSCIPNWSDIDILIVVDSMNFALVRKVERAKQKYNIKIALSVLTLYELDNNMLDGKTKVALYLLGEEHLAPNYVNCSAGVFMIPRITLEEVQLDDAYMLPEYLHKLKRALYLPEDNRRAVIKLLYLVMKIKLRSPRHKIVAKTYREASERFAAEFEAPELDFEAEIKRKSGFSEVFLDDAREIVRRICDGEI